jgi:hypothetical protein
MEIPLLRRVERHLRRTGTSPSLFGRKALNDARLVADLRRGRKLRVGTEARVLAYIAAAEGLGGGRKCRGR